MSESLITKVSLEELGLKEDQFENVQLVSTDDFGLVVEAERVSSDGQRKKVLLRKLNDSDISLHP